MNQQVCRLVMYCVRVRVCVGLFNQTLSEV